MEDNSDSKFPVNRIVAFAGPYIAVVSGAIADWLFVHVHFLSIFHTSKTPVSGAITQVVVFGLTALLVWAGHQKWLSGWQSWEKTVAGEMANGADMEAPTGVYDPTSEPEGPAAPPADLA